MRETVIAFIVVAFVILCGYVGTQAYLTNEKAVAQEKAHCELLWSMTTTPTDSIIVLIECGTS